MPFPNDRLEIAKAALQSLTDRQHSRPGILMARWRDLAAECTARDDELTASEQAFLASIIIRQRITPDQLTNLCDIAAGLRVLENA